MNALRSAEARMAILELLALPDPPELPTRAHHLTQRGDPWRRLPPVRAHGGFWGAQNSVDASADPGRAE